MRTMANLRKCVFMVLALVMGGEMVQARHRHIYRTPVYSAGRCRVTVINHVASPVKVVQHISSRERWGMITAYLGKHPNLSIKEYAAMTGLSKKMAEAELDAFAADKKKNLAVTVVGKKKLYSLYS